MSLLFFLSFILIGTHGFGVQKAVITHNLAPSPFLAIVSSYSTQLEDVPGINPTSNELKGLIVNHESDPLGCSDWQTLESNNNNNNNLKIGIIDRGSCTFLIKTHYAQSAGINLLIIISDDATISPMSADNDAVLKLYNNEDPNNNNNNLIIPTLMVSKEFKDFLLSLNSNSNNQYLTVSIHESKIYDFAMVVMIFISTILTVMGAYYSSDVERCRYYGDNKSTLHRRRQHTQTIDTRFAWSFILIASCGLLTLYFFVEYIFVVIVIVFCIGATNGLGTILTHFIDYLYPNLQKKEYFISYLDLDFTLSDIIGFIPAFLFSLFWYINRLDSDLSWILQNIMCCGLLMQLQRTLRLNNLKIATILLGTAFVYDIFWVFISPYFFESSVMVKVATYHHNDSPKDTLPVVLQFPRINDVFHSPMILGLGDIALPGLFISYILRFDYNSKLSTKNGYFLPVVIGYAVGMLLCDINLVLMQKGQPALLFLVPCTVGLVSYLGYRRGHLSFLWNGKNYVNSKYTSLFETPK